MSGYDLYVFILCLIVAGLMIGLAAFMVTKIYQLTVKSIKHGLDDEQIKKEYLRTQEKGKKNKGLDFILSLFLCLILCVAFAFSLYVNLSDESFSDTIPTLRVVKSDSMSSKHERNVYLAENDLNDQFFTFDIILTYKIPDEEDLELYDIVVYESNGTYIVHRIVGIEEPTEDNHPGERWFVCQGDANGVSDRFPVKYESMKGIYKGERIPFIGSFVLFMQSPAGWLCVFLVVAAFFIIPFVDKKIWNAILARLRAIGFIDEGGNLILVDMVQNQNTEITAPPVVEQTAVEKTQAIVAESQVIDDEFDDEIDAQGLSLAKRKRDDRDFFEMLAATNKAMQARYVVITDIIDRIEGLTLRPSKKYRSYCLGNKTLIKLSVRGYILYANLALDVDAYEDTKYLYTDERAVKKFSTTPMCVSQVTDLRTGYLGELLIELARVYGLTVREDPVEEVAVTEKINAFSHLKGKRDDRDFFEMLTDAGEVAQTRYAIIKELLERVDGLKVRPSRKYQSHYSRGVTLVKLAVRGKTLNAYLALDVKEYENSKYKYLDESETKKHISTPMRMKLTSDRQTRHTLELISKLAKINGLEIKERVIAKVNVNAFNHLKGKRDDRSFFERLEVAPDHTKERFEKVESVIKAQGVLKLGAGKKVRAYKYKNNSAVKMYLRGKTLNLYLALDPKQFENTKYKYTDVSAIKKYETTPMRVKLTSDRQVKHAGELIVMLVDKFNKGGKS